MQQSGRSVPLAVFPIARVDAHLHPESFQHGESSQ